jgi:FkbM family methyltransferase
LNTADIDRFESNDRELIGARIAMITSTMRHIARCLPKRLVGWLAYHYPCHQTTYSRFAEDIPLARLLPEADGFYVDIGAFHPKFRSNTYQLWKRGWHGINVDVDDFKMAQFRHFRPHDVNLTLGISSVDGERTFYCHGDGAYGSMSSMERDFAVDRAQKMERRVESRTVPVWTLNTLLERHVPRRPDGSFITVDLLDIDVEGHELEVLHGLDFGRFAPRCLCIEIHAAGMAELVATPTFRLLWSHGYELVAWPAPSCIFTRPPSSTIISGQLPARYGRLRRALATPPSNRRAA